MMILNEENIVEVNNNVPIRNIDNIEDVSLLLFLCNIYKMKIGYNCSWSFSSITLYNLIVK